MTDAPLIQRLSEAVQAQRETTARLQELAAELTEHCARMRALSDKLQAALVQTSILPGVSQASYDAQMDIARMPRFLSKGPQVRDG